MPWLWRIATKARWVPGIYWLWRRSFPGSWTHWQRHYERGGNSGPGSYGESAEYKAQLINRAVAENGIAGILELGCGDGNQLSYLNVGQYIGLDVSKVAIDLCVARYAEDPTRTFIWYDQNHFHDPLHVLSADCAMSLDVVYHLKEPDVFALYLKNLFGCGRRFVIIYGMDHDDNSRVHASILYRKYSDHIARNFPDFRVLTHVPPQGTFGDFYVYERAV